MAKRTEAADRIGGSARRADAQRSITAILNAAVEVLASDPDSSMSEIARRAGVVRATIYVHFPNRDALLDAVMDYAIGQVVEEIRATEPERGQASEALERLLRATWQRLALFRALVTLNISRLPQDELHRRHLPFIELLAPLIARGQRDGVFRRDLPVAWHLSIVLAIVHAASRELVSERIPPEDAEDAVVRTALAAIG